MNDDLPVHVRATQISEPRRFLIFRGGYIVYDVRYLDGTIESDVKLYKVLNSARYPADFSATRRGADAVAGDGVPGQWVDYPYGRPIPE